jgi:hypothetical protein
MFLYAPKQLKQAQLLPEQYHHVKVAAILRELLKKGSISEGTFYRLTGGYAGDELLETKVFAFHYKSREITFKSILMQRYCEELSALWEEEKKEEKR